MKTIFDLIIPNASSEFWTMVSAISTMIVSIIAIKNTSRRVKVIVNYCCIKIYEDQSIKLIKISIINNCDKMIYINDYGVKITKENYYHEVINFKNKPFYYKSLPIMISPGESIDLWLNFNHFYNMLNQENFLNRKYCVYVVDSFGKIWLSKNRISYKKVKELYDIPLIINYKKIDNK